MNQVVMVERAVAFFAPVAAYLPATLSPDVLAGWLPSMVGTTRRSAPPLLHVLLDVFINAQPRVIFNAINQGASLRSAGRTLRLDPSTVVVEARAPWSNRALAY